MSSQAKATKVQRQTAAVPSSARCVDTRAWYAQHVAVVESSGKVPALFSRQVRPRAGSSPAPPPTSSRIIFWDEAYSPNVCVCEDCCYGVLSMIVHVTLNM
jgi:hypothetical protein